MKIQVKREYLSPCTSPYGNKMGQMDQSFALCIILNYRDVGREVGRVFIRDPAVATDHREATDGNHPSG